MKDDERGQVSRRALLGYLGFLGVSTAGGGFLVKKFLEGDGDSGPSDLIPTIDYNPGDTYDGDDDGIVITPEPGHDPVDTWEEALPGECSLSADERHWLVSRVDSYDDLEGDDFFDYVNEEVRLYDTGSELRMEIDEDFNGTEFEPDKGYNIPDTC